MILHAQNADFNRPEQEAGGAATRRSKPRIRKEIREEIYRIYRLMKNAADDQQLMQQLVDGAKAVAILDGLNSPGMPNLRGDSAAMMELGTAMIRAAQPLLTEHG
jgi:hypothetical protein